MDNNYATKKRRKDLIKEFVALQHAVSSINYAYAMYIVILHAAFKKKEIRLQLPRSPHPYGKQIDHLSRLVNDSDINCHDQLRMNRHTFMLLCGLVQSVGLSDLKYVVLEEQVAMFFNVFAHHTKNRKIKFNFMRSGQTVSKHFNNVLKAVLRLYGLLLKKPEPITANCTDDRWSYGTYVKVRAPAIDKPRYRTRKGEIATNVLGVCSQDMQLIYVLPGWEGSASDSRVLRDAVSRPNGLKVPTGNEEMNPPPPATELGDEMIDVVEASDQWSMDDTGTISSRKKGKPRRFWNHREEVFLVITMKDVIASNPRWKLDNNQFRAGFYNECEKKILSAFPGTDLRASPHIDSKIKFWRKQYNALQDMLNISGFGWDDEQKMVLGYSDDVWQNYVRRVPDAKGMRNRPFPFYEDWLILFGKDKATGELAEDPADAVAAMEKDDVNATTEEGEQSPVKQFSMNMGDTDYSMSTAGNVPNRADSTKTEKKRARPTEGIPTELSEMEKNLGSFIENTNTTMVEIAHRIGYSHDLSQQRRLVNAELLKLPMSNTQRLMATSMIVKDEDKVDLFFSLDENDKMEWVSLLLEGALSYKLISLQTKFVASRLHQCTKFK
ncbi:unnamed protein product [Camellia sinensis]